MRRIILGNPLKLINDVAPFDIPAVMFLPLELVIRELSAGGGTDIIYVSYPSWLFDSLGERVGK